MRYVAFLRGINVSGQKLIKMETLKPMFNIPGFKNIVTYIQSGNVIFDSKDPENLRGKVEKLLFRGLGYQVPAMIRSLDEMKDIIAANPFANTDMEGKKLYVYFLSAAPAAERVEPMKNVLVPGEEFIIRGQEIYFLTPGYGTTKFSNTYVEKKLAVQSTVRNWSTINKVLDL